MDVDTTELMRLAIACGEGQWDATGPVVWFADGDSALRVRPPLLGIAHSNIGHWPDAIMEDDVAAYVAAACPATMVKLLGRLAELENMTAMIPVKDHVLREVVNNLRDVAVKFHDCGQLRERLRDALGPLVDQR